MTWKASCLRLVGAVATAVMIAGCSKDPEVAKAEYVRSAQEFARKGEFKQAILQYRNAIRVDPRYGEARLELANLLQREGDLGGAHTELVRAADLLPKSVEAQVRAAEIRLLAGQYEDAASSADRAIALDQQNVRALLLKGNALAGQKRFDDAVAEIEKAIALDPTQSGSYGNLGALQFAQGHHPEAEAALKRAVAVAPTTEMGPRIALTGFYVATKRIALAEETLATALAEQPRNADVNRALATLFLTTGRADKAEAPLKIVVEEQHDLRSQLTLADYYRTMRRDEDALTLLDRAAAGKAGFSAALTRKAAIFRQQKKHDRSYAALDEVLKKDPRDQSALVLKSMFLADDGKVDAALQTIEAAVRVESAAATQFVLGRVQQMRGATAAASTAYLETLRLQPRHPEALHRLAEISLAGLRLEDARSYAQDALKYRPDYPEVLLIRARVDMALGEHARAEDTLRQLTTRYPASAAAHAQLGTLLASKQHAQPARTAYERALSIDPIAIEPIAGLVSMDLKSGNTAAARARVDAALAKAPRSAGLLVVAAQANMTFGDAAKAESLLRSAISIDPARLPAYAMLAGIYVSQDRLDRAITELEEVARRQPDVVGAPTMIAMLLEQQKKIPEAQARYEQIVSDHKSAPIAANNLAWIYSEHGGSLDKALELAQTAKSGLPESAEVSDTIGWIYFKKKMFPQAVHSLKEAAARDPKNIMIQYHLGLAYASNAEYALAKGILATALKNAPTAPGAREARAALDLISTMGL